MYRLNVAAVWVKIWCQGGSSTIRREYVEHFIGKLDDHDLSKSLALLRLLDAIENIETLQVHQRIKVRQTQASMVLKTFYSRSDAALNPVSLKLAREVREIHVQSERRASESKSSVLDD